MGLDGVLLSSPRYEDGTREFKTMTYPSLVQALPRQWRVSPRATRAHCHQADRCQRGQAAPGVLCVLAGADALTDKIGGLPPFFMLDSWGGPPGFPTKRPVLLADRGRLRATAGGG